ncbi:MAG: ankyrin repeat domain-containing protein [Spirochaetia bacterium]|nr:ankyrin repeat domain-containing protein [Spirochaetia bacterium]
MKRRFLLCLSLIAIFMFITASVSADDAKDMNSAIEAGDIAKVKTLLDGGYNPNTPVPNGQPPVMAAANTGNAEIVSLFIKAGADVSIEAEDYLGGNALTGAVWSTRDTHDPANTIKIIQILLDAGIDINSGEVRDESGDFEVGGKKWESYITPLYYVTCVRDCSADVLEFMLNKGCKPSGSFAVSETGDERRDSSVDDLSDSVKKSKTNKDDRKEYNRIQKILKNAEQKPEPKPVAVAEKPAADKPAEKAEPAEKPESESKAAPVKKPKVKKSAPAPKPAEVVPENYASVILTAPEATEMLRKSVQDGNMEKFYRSLVMGADINSMDQENKSVLLLAVMAQNKEMAEVLIYKGAEVNVKSKGGNTPLSMSRDLGAKDIEQLLLKAGAKQ